MREASVTYRLEFLVMGGPAEITAYCADEAAWQRTRTALVAEARRIEAKYSRYRDDSVTTRINRAAGGDPVPVDAETAALLAYADACYKTSGGLFDITSGVLRRAWDFKRPRLPDQQEIDALLLQVGWDMVEWSNSACRLARAGMELDFGGIGKEYAADRLAGIAAAHGLAHALVNLAGDIRAVGPRPDGTPWRIGIPHPRRAAEVCAELTLEQGAIATSGDYERYIEVDGRRYCHLLNPRTGWPVEGLASVSVLAPLCTVAGSLSTIGMLMGEAGIAFLREQALPALVIRPDGSGERLPGAASGKTGQTYA